MFRLKNFTSFSAIFLFLSAFNTAFSQVNSIESPKLTINPTFEHIAFHWDFIGDENHNSAMSIQFKPTGDTSYFQGAICMRAFPEMLVDNSNLNMNFHAGSALHLLPNTEYQLKLSLDDPDGGSLMLDTVITTNKYPSEEQSQDTIFVIPGNSGGDGTAINPYQGLQTAIDFAAVGKVIFVADGLYDPFTLNQSGTESQPIVIKSANLLGAIIDGGNTDRGVVTIGVFDDSIQYVILDGFEIRNGKWGIDAQNTQYFTVKNNRITDVDWGIYNRRGNGWEHDQYITNNELIGRTFWPQTNGEIPGERGIDIRGNRNVVSYNSISLFGDGITTDGQPYKVSYALDIHHNDISKIVDDLIEIDGTISNTRVYKNRCYNGRMGVSTAPVFGGPAYIFKNEFYNLEYSLIKMNRKPAGLIILNNSVVKLDKGMSSNAGWQNTIFKNNVVISDHYVMEEYELVSGSNDEWDYNGYRSERDGTSGGPWFKWDNIRYNDVASINASEVTEGNSLNIDYIDFMDLSMPLSYATAANPMNQNFQLALNSSLIDAGTVFNNILDLDDISGRPDIGVYEFGQDSVVYGHDFELVCDRDILTQQTWNGSINSGWFETKNWTPCGVPSSETNVIIPPGLSSYPFVNTNTHISNLSILGDGKLYIVDGVVFKIGD